MSLFDWPRKYYQSGGGNPYVGYVVFGDIKQPLNLSASKYRSAGVPQGVQISSYTAERHAETFRFFLESSFLKALTTEDAVRKEARFIARVDVVTAGPAESDE